MNLLKSIVLVSLTVIVVIVAGCGGSSNVGIEPVTSSPTAIVTATPNPEVNQNGIETVTPVPTTIVTTTSNPEIDQNGIEPVVVTQENSTDVIESSAVSSYNAQLLEQVPNYYPAIAMGETIYMKLRFKNTGTKKWYRNQVNVGGWNNRDRNIGFYVPGGKGWISSNRIRMVESVVNPGEIGTFEFIFRANPSSIIKGGTCHKEYLRMVADLPGGDFFGPSGIYWVITVFDRNPVYIPNNGTEVWGDTGKSYYQKYVGDVVCGRKYTVRLNSRNSTNLDLYVHTNIGVGPNCYSYCSKKSGSQEDSVTFTATQTGKIYIIAQGISDEINSYKLQLSEASSGNTALQQTIMNNADTVAKAINSTGGYRFDGWNDCYGFDRRVWDPVLKSLNMSVLPISDAPSSNWVEITDWKQLKTGDVLATHKGHQWGANWHGGLYAGYQNGVHYIYDCSPAGTGMNGAYRRALPYNGFFKYYYNPVHKIL
ncbi:MAG: PPC domain-containing protein [Candidatus Eremiobacterota bacterium]